MRAIQPASILGQAPFQQAADVERLIWNLWILTGTSTANWNQVVTALEICCWSYFEGYVSMFMCIIHLINSVIYFESVSEGCEAHINVYNVMSIWNQNLLLIILLTSFYKLHFVHVDSFMPTSLMSSNLWGFSYLHYMLWWCRPKVIVNLRYLYVISVTR
jgi:hypothetical protein